MKHILVIVNLLLVLPFMGRSVAAQTTGEDSTRTARDPQKALMLSIVPGGGQAYNRAWLKVIGVIAAEIYFVNQFQLNRDNVKQYPDGPDGADFSLSRYLEKRNKYAWWVLGTYLFAMADAYVDAHLDSFPQDSTAKIIIDENPRTEEQ